MADNIRTELEKKVYKAHVEHALFRWESAVTIAATLLSMVGFALAENTLATITSLAVGTVIEGVIVASSLTDKELKRKVEDELTRRKFDIKKIGDKHLQAQFLEAQDYQQRIEAALGP